MLTFEEHIKIQDTQTALNQELPKQLFKLMGAEEPQDP